MCNPYDIANYDVVSRQQPDHTAKTRSRGKNRITRDKSGFKRDLQEPNCDPGYGVIIHMLHLSFYSTHRLITAIHYLLPDTYYLILVTCYLLPDACYLLFVTCYLLRYSCQLMNLTWYFFPGARSLIPVTIYLLHSNYYLILVTGYLLPNACYPYFDHSLPVLFSTYIFLILST